MRFAMMLLGLSSAALSAATLAAEPASTTPPRGPHTPSHDVAAPADDPPVPTATAVVVKSWSNCDSDEVAWSLLNRDWAQFGDVRIRIDYDNQALCGEGAVTYDALEASGAQTVILSDTAGGTHQLGDDEIAAITRYVEEGHNLVATYLTLQYRGIDNRGLAPLFGLDPAATYGWRRHASGPYTLRPHPPLFDGLGGEYQPGGYLGSQLPPGDHWTNAAAEAGRILGYAQDRRGAILQYCGAGFRSILFSQMPEFEGDGVEDQQLLYNAIVMGRKPGCAAHRGG